MLLTRTAIEPILPEQYLRSLDDLACSVLEQAARLDQKVRPELRKDLAELTRWMHCYYSNLIEGQQTRVRDIEAALQQNFAAEPEKRSLQQLALAHLAVQKWAATSTGSPYQGSFFCELHRLFYSQLPAEMRVATTSSGQKSPLQPGELRTGDVEVGTHVAPPCELVPGLLEHFSLRYESGELSRTRKVIAVAASHHRFAWIHPFRDGNGRVARLFSDTLIRQLGIDGGGLWSLSRGLAVQRSEYYALLSNADQERSARSADDGRGHLSERALRDFCTFVLRVMLDQIAFMDSLLELNSLAARIEHYTKVEAGFGQEADGAFLLLREALYRGEFARGEAGRIIGAAERKGRMVLAKVIEAGLLKSDTPKSKVRLALPAKALATYFPQLFPIDQFGKG